MGIPAAQMPAKINIRRGQRRVASEKGRGYSNRYTYTLLTRRLALPRERSSFSDPGFKRHLGWDPSEAPVILAEDGIQPVDARFRRFAEWIPAFAEMKYRKGCHSK